MNTGNLRFLEIFEIQGQLPPPKAPCVAQARLSCPGACLETAATAGATGRRRSVKRHFHAAGTTRPTARPTCATGAHGLAASASTAKHRASMSADQPATAASGTATTITAALLA